MNSNDRASLIKRINTLEGLTDKERSALLGLLRENKTYGLVWEDKPEDVEERLRDELPILTEVPERAIISEDKDAPNHILIEGDNLEALATLAYTHEGKIDVIYIDPPYNTGNKDFRYNDSYVDKEDSYRHSKWLSFMSRRLKIAKKLLADDGVIFISIDDNEQAQLKMLCDSSDLFGENNFRNNILVRRRIKSLNSQFAYKGLFSLNVGFEYILCYSKTNQYLMPALRMTKEKAPTKGRWDVFWSNADRPTMRYEILGFTPETGQWRNSKEKADIAIKNYKEYQDKYSEEYSLEEYSETTGITDFIRRIPNGKGKNGGVQHWIAPDSTSLRTSNWTDIEVSQIGKEFDLPFDNPKSKLLMMEILKMTRKENPVILDFFAGSGTTLHATMQLNAEDGGRRQCILVTNNENNICEEVTYKRNKQVINGYKTPKGTEIPGLTKNNLRYYRTGFVGRNRSMQNMRKLVNLATDMLCIKENLYKEQNTFGGQNTYKGIFRYFDDGKKQMLVIYREEAIDELVDIIYDMDISQPIKVYVFSPSEDPWEGSFDDVSDKVELCALPQAIYNTYRRILPKKKDAVVMPEEDALATTEEEEEQFNGMLNFEYNEEV